MDNERWLEMTGSIPVGTWQRFRSIGAEISLIVVKWLSDLFALTRASTCVLTIPGRYYGNVP